MIYDPRTVLALFDTNAAYVIGFCGLAMVFNYIWFTLAAIRGFRDRVYPIPMFSTLLWLCGDGTGVLRYDMYFNVYDHWYLKLFWGALVLTVSFELLYIYMTFKFGRREVAPGMSRIGFAGLLSAAAVIFAVTWACILSVLPDDLNIIYFNLANMAGPIAFGAMILRRRSIAGTSSMIWVFYTLMLSSWYFAQLLFFGPAFRTPLNIAFICVNLASSIALAVYVRAQERKAKLIVDG